MKRARAWSAKGAILVAATAVTVLAGSAGGASAGGAQRGLITIGWAFDGVGQMAPFDGPALAAARIRVSQINRRGGVRGRRFEIQTCNTQNNNPVRARTCASRLLARGADIIFTTCDVDFATPVVQRALNRRVLAIAPCIGTDQMGPKRFGRAGRLAFSFGNVAQDEGSAMAEYARRRGWRTAATATNTVIVYFRDVVRAFEARFRQLGGRIVARESYATGANNVQTAVSRLNGRRADVYVTSTAFAELPAFVSGLRSLGNRTPILNSWAGDGTYWLPRNPRVTNYYYVTYVSAFGDDPSPAVRRLIAAMRRAGATPATGGFVAGAGAIDGIATAIRRARGSTNGTRLAAQLERFKRVPTISGRVSFSRQFHTVFGRQYRVMRIHNNRAQRVGLVTAKVIPRIG